MLKQRPRAVWLTSFGGILVVCVLAVVFFDRSQNTDDLKLRQPADGENAREQLVEVGGVRRPITDVRPVQRSDRRPSAKDVRPFDYGTAPPIPRNANPHVQSVAEALETGEHPERLSPMIAPKRFDKEEYLRDPQKYLNTVEPGRVWQTAQPGPGVPRLKSRSPSMARIEQGQSVTFRVEVAPGAPATFTSFDLGAFQNQLTSITVRADEKGVAQATFTGTSGTINFVSILVGSPMASGQLRFIVDVLPPRGTARP